MSTHGESPILLLHSSCRGIQEEDDSTEVHSDGRNTSGLGNDNDDAVLDLVATHPIVCDLLLLPEFGLPETSLPQDESSSNTSVRDQYLSFTETEMNPCGFSNVLSLENLPELWNEGPVLLSLTSCNIRYGDSDGDSSANLFLPVKPSPSTFVLEFESYAEAVSSVRHDKDEEYHHEPQKVNGTNNYITTGKKLTEILVEFDLREALIQMNEFLRYNQNSRNDPPLTFEIDEVDYKGLPEDESHRQHNNSSRGKDCGNTPETKFCPESEARDKEQDSHSNGDQPVSKEPIFCNSHLAASVANLHYHEQKRLLSQINSRIQNDTRTMDLVLRICGAVFICLILLLAWAIYQYHRSVTQSNIFSREIRESLKTSSGLLQEAIDGLDHCGDLSQQRKEDTLSVVSRELKSISIMNNSTPTELDWESGNHQTKTDSVRLDLQTPLHKDHSRINTDHLRGSDKQSSNLTSPSPYSASKMILCDDDTSTEIHMEEFHVHGNAEKKDKLIALMHDNKDVNITAHTYEDEMKRSACNSHTKDESQEKHALPFTPIPHGIDSNSVSTKEVSPMVNSRNSCMTVEGTTKETNKDIGVDVQINLKSSLNPIPFLDLPMSPNQDRTKEFSFLGKFPRRNHNSYHPSKSEKEAGSTSPSMQLINEWNEDKDLFTTCDARTNDCHLSQSLKPHEGQKEGKTTSVQVTSTKQTTPVQLSPCSQLAKDWKERKTIRRSNVKTKQRPRLKPMLSHDDGGKILFESTILSRVPRNSKLRSRYHQHQDTQQQAYAISGPPRLKLVASRNDALLGDGENAATDSSLSSASLSEQEDIEASPSSSTEKTPRLCYTPASEDDSFVADYW